MSLVDKFGRVHKYLRVSLTDMCNLRCSYCMPEGSPAVSKKGKMSLEQMDRLLSVLVDRCGITKIRLTGGEPTLRADFFDILQIMKKQKVLLGITTNGVLLDKYLPALVDSGFSLLNISMDTLDRAKFPLISNRGEQYWDRAHRGFLLSQELLVAGEIQKLKINTVVMNHMNSDEIVDFVALTQNLNIEVRFIELMPFAGNSYSEKLFLSKDAILALITERFGAVERLAGSGSVGRNLFRVPTFVGSFGIISSMTDSFCGSCDRLRLTANGSLRNCLFANDDTEKRLLDFESNEEIEAAIRECVAEKFAAYGGKLGPADLFAQSGKTRPMVEIGG